MQDWISSSGSGQNCVLVFTNGGLGFGWISGIGYPAPKRWASNSWLLVVGWGCIENNSAHVFLVKMNSTTKSWEIRRLIDFLQEKPFVSGHIFPKKHTQSFSSHFSQVCGLLGWFSYNQELVRAIGSWRHILGMIAGSFPKPETNSQHL